MGEVDITAQDKAKIEEMLLPELMAGLDKLSPDQKVIFKLSLPEKPNLYAPLMGYPQVVRVVALSGGYDLEESNKRLSQNAGMIASFSRTLREGLKVTQTDEEFTKTLGDTLDKVTEASKAPSYGSQVGGNAIKEEQLRKMTMDPGFISALDESGGTSPKTLAAYGITDKDYKDQDEMMSKVHDLRAKIMTNPTYKEGSIIGAILFEDTINRDVEGIPTAQYLWDKKKVVPFLKSDVGLAPAADGVQMMKDHPGLEDMLDRGLAKGIWGMKQRSQIQSANPEGIKKLVEQQFEFGKRTIAKGMIPILEPEVDITAKDKAQIEEMLLPELMKGLATLKPEDKVIFKLSLPEKANLYAPLMGYPQVVRVVALSGGYDLAESNKRLAENAGMIASFSRTLREGLHVSQSDEEFTMTLGATLDAVTEASKAPSYGSQVSGNAVKSEQLKKMTKDAGFISALDESGGTSPKTLAA